MIEPLPGFAAVTPFLHSEAFAKDVKERSGLLVQTKHDHINSFEGVPSQGYVKILPSSYHGEIKVGQRVVFNQPNPQGVELQGEKMFFLPIESIIGVISE